MLRKFKIKIDGNEYAVEMEELTPTPQQPVAPAPQAAPAPQPAAQPAAEAAPAPKATGTGAGTAVEAPMPGNIIDIKVKVGDTVAEGQVVLILEAMKMENEIVAAKAGVITGINCVKGDVVSTGDTLLTIQ